MVKWIKGLFHKKDQVPNWYELAEQEHGVKEIPGAKDNPRIVEYHATTTLKATDDETSWCSSFVNWCFAVSGFTGTNSAAARSWLRWGKKLSKPRKGCVVVFWRGSPSSWKGHVGFYAGQINDGKILILGGNQSDGVNFQWYSMSQVLDYRWPE